MVKRILAVTVMFSLLGILACGTAAPEVIEKEVIKEVEVEKIVEVEKEKLVDVIKTVEKLVIATPTAAPPPEAVVGPAGLVISATSDMAEMGLDPSLDNSSNVKTFFDEIHLYGIMQAPDGQLIGGAASKWEVSEDQLSWIYTVRDDVKFHNGDTMTAEDMEFSWNRSICPGPPTDGSCKAENSTSAVQGPATESIIAEGNTIVVRTHEPEALMPLWWPSYEGGQAGTVQSKAEYARTGDEGMRNNPIGAGSFKFLERSRGEFIKMEAHEDHYCCVPGFKNLTVLEVPEIATRLALLKTGGADLIEASPQVKPDLVDSGFTVYSGRGATSSSMWFPYQNIEGSPFADIKVRKAFALAINRDAIAERLYNGEGGATSSFFSGPGSFGFNEEIDGYGYDLDEAKKLMNEAGYGDGFQIRIVTYSYDADFPDMPTLSQAVLGDLQELGIEGDVQVKEWTAVKSHMVDMLHAVCGGDTTWCIDNPAHPEVAFEEPYNVILRGNDTRFHALRQNRGYMHPDGRRPFIQVGWLTEEMDKVAAQFDFGVQEEMFKEYNRKVNEEYVQNLLLYANSVFGASDKIASWEPITGRTYPNNQWSLKPAK
jgi:ABC-type transport system substrate-binding protein